MNVKDITGQVFGRLTVLEFLESRIITSKKGKESRKRVYKCRCICGKEVNILRDNLVSDTTRSCGCYAKEQVLKRNKERRLPNNQSLWNLGYKSHLKDASIRNLSSFISFDKYIEITSKNCFYCDKPPVKKTHENLYGEIYRNGLDRIDSSKNYTEDNVRPCCSVCNYMKLDMSEGEFFKHINKIHETCAQKEVQLIAREIKSLFKEQLPSISKALNY